MTITALLLFISSLLAFAISAICGGGASFVLIPLLKLVLPAAQVPAALSIGTASSSLSRIAVLRHNIRWDLVRWFIPPAIPAVALGAWLLTYVNPLYLEFFLGLYLLLNLPLLFKEQRKATTEGKVGNLSISVIGFLTGFVSGLTGAVGLIFNRFYLTYGLSKEQIVATRAANELILHLIKIGLYATFGLIVHNTLIYGLILAMAALISTFGIRYILPLISENLFQKIGYAAMVLSGMFMFGSAVQKITRLNQFDIDYFPIAKGIETKLQWKQYNFSVEFEYDEGFEFEQSIELSAVPEPLQTKIRRLLPGTDKYMIEEVFGYQKHNFELYLWRKGKFKKYDVK